ncbi:hypothetical protein MUA04_19560 [Enterobacteriaceae bacterium H11S18]|nr:hypothetical protein [Dryocola clanedunensis]
MNDVEKQNAKLNLGIHEVFGYITKELNGSFFRFCGGVQAEVQAGVQREEAITGRAGLPQQATSPKLAKSKEIQSK